MATRNDWAGKAALVLLGFLGACSSGSTGTPAAGGTGGMAAASTGGTNMAGASTGGTNAGGLIAGGRSGFLVCQDGAEIDLSLLCNGTQDCQDGSDESACGSGYVCQDGTEIDLSLLCNGTQDCQDGSDECACVLKAGTCLLEYNTALVACGEDLCCLYEGEHSRCDVTRSCNDRSGQNCCVIYATAETPIGPGCCYYSDGSAPTSGTGEDITAKCQTLIHQ